MGLEESHVVFRFVDGGSRIGDAKLFHVLRIHARTSTSSAAYVEKFVHYTKKLSPLSSSEVRASIRLGARGGENVVSVSIYGVMFVDDCVCVKGVWNHPSPLCT